MQTNILFVITNSALNRGMNTGLENLAWSLASKDLHVHILSGGSMPKNHNYKIPDTVKYHFTNKKGDNPLSFVKPFEEIARNYEVNVVIGWIINIAPLIKIGIKNNIRFIANQGQIAPRSLLLSYLKRILTGRISVINAIKILYSIFRYRNQMKAVVSISKTVQDSCIKRYKLNKNKCIVIPRGIDTDRYTFKKREPNFGKPRLLYAGNIKTEKGLDDLVNALQYINTPVHVTFCGKGDIKYINQLYTKVKRYNLGHEINFTGPVSQMDLIKHYHKCDLFIFPSHSEGLGKALLEAMSCGCPIICSDIPTFKEIITHKHNGLIVQTNNPILFSKAIKDLIEDYNLRNKLSVNGRELIERKFNNEYESKKWLRLIQRT